MGLIEQTSFLSGIFGEFSYVGPFVVLLLCGIGLPIPEEVTLILSGILVHEGKVEFLPIVLVCSTAVLLGDSVPFLLGRRYGTSALRIRWVARVLHPERFEKVRKRFEDHGNWATFACRFFAGIRIPGYFVAGTMGMRYARFAILDALGILISVPLSIYMGELFGGQIDKLNERVADFHMILAFVAVALALIMIVGARRRSRLARAAAAKASAANDADEAPPEAPGSAADRP